MTNDLVSAILIAIVQGITEWLPVSSSGHIIIAEKLLNYEGDLQFDVALHFGTLMAAFVYYGADIVDIIRDLLTGKWQTEKGKLGILLIIATIPAALIGIFFLKVFSEAFSDILILGFGFAITGMLLLIASLPNKKNKKEISYYNSLIIGIAQAFALFPGISRSGATISSGLLSGLNEKNAVKFSFLMSIPIIFGANVVLIGNENLPPNLIWATLVSFFVGLLTINILVKYILTSNKNLRWFGIYALLLSILIIIFKITN